MIEDCGGGGGGGVLRRGPRHDGGGRGAGAVVKGDGVAGGVEVVGRGRGARWRHSGSGGWEDMVVIMSVPVFGFVFVFVSVFVKEVLSLDEACGDIDCGDDWM